MNTNTCPIAVTSSVKMQRSKLADFYRIQKMQLTATGAWPDENKSPWRKRRFFFVTIFTFTLFYLAMFYEVTSDFSDFGKLSKILYIFSSCTAYAVKMWGFVYNWRIFRKMMEEIDNPLISNFPYKYDTHLTVLRKVALILSKTYLASAASVIVLYAVYPVVDEEPLPMPFPKKLGPYNPIMYVIQLVGIGVTTWNNAALDNLCANLLSFIAGQFDVLMRKIEDVRSHALETLKILKAESSFTSEEINRTVEKLLNEYVEHHLAIIRFAELTDRVFSIPILGQFGATIVLMCNSIFSIMLTTPGSLKFLMLVLYLCVGTCELTLYCWFGNEVILKSEAVRDACYMSDWTECSSEIRRYLFIIMERSKRSTKITAYKFSVASLFSFKSVLQWSYSYFALLRRLSTKDN